MVLHSIGRSEGPGVTNPWIAKYIFPGGYIPALSEVLPVIERAGLLVTDIEILRLHYAETLKAWRERFLAHRDDAERIYEPRFARMPRDGAIIFSDLIGKLDVLRVICSQCERDGCYGLSRLINQRGRDAKLIDWLDIY